MPAIVACGEKCRMAIYAAKGRRKPIERLCQTCGQPFVPKRADALTCSPACRQRAYRQRQHAEAA
jgi:hypothetical protein